jgi:gas vesicle protein
MRTITKGILIGLGIGLLVAPMKGKDLRKQIGERFNETRNSLQENDQLNTYIHQVQDKVSPTVDSLKDRAQQAVSQVKDSSNQLGSKVQQKVQEFRSSNALDPETGKQPAVNAPLNNAINSAQTSGATSKDYKIGQG